MSYPDRYPSTDWTGNIHAVNEILQGRSDRTLASLLSELTQGTDYDGKLHILLAEIQDFYHQKELFAQPYNKSSNIDFPYEMFDLGSSKLKIITQDIFDRAAKAGFPPDFFRKSYFDQVTIYCMPECADLNFSTFNECKFAVCRINGASFDGASIYSSEFHSVELFYSTFFHAGLSYTHFQDSHLKYVSFQRASLRRCNTTDCVLDSMNYLDARLDGCSFANVAASKTRNLLTAVITQGGATSEECERNRLSVIGALIPMKTSQARNLPRNRGAR